MSRSRSQGTEVTTVTGAFLVCVEKQTDEKQASRFSNVRTNPGFWLAGVGRWR